MESTRELESDNDSKCSSAESEEPQDDEEDHLKDFENYSYPNDYWKLKKVIKYLSYSRPVITALALIIANDCDYQDPIMLKCLDDYRILEILLNFLHSSDNRIQSISLRFLRHLSKMRTVRQDIARLGGIETLVSMLDVPQIDINKGAAEVIRSVADFHKAWVRINRSNGIALLVNMLFLPRSLLFEKDGHLSEQMRAVISAAEVAAEALFVVCECRKNRREFLMSGGLMGCQNILKSTHVRLSVLVLKIIEKCSSERIVRVAVSKLGMLEDFGVHFYSDDPKLVHAAALAAFRCAEEEDSEQFFGKPGFVDRLFEILQTSLYHTDFPLMIAISGAMWKCSENEDNVQRMQELNCAPLLVQLLNTQPKHVLENLVACLSCCLSNPQIRTTVRKNNGVEAMIGLLFTIHPPLIMQLNKALATVATDAECLAILESNNALRLIWSHLKNKDPSVVSNTAWQLAAILKNVKDSAKYVRSFVGGVQVIIECLGSKHTRVTTAICALIVVLCKERDNLRILTNYNVVDSLTRLSGTKCRRLRYHLCLAITACSPYRNNRDQFAKRRIVYPLIKMLKSNSDEVSSAATHALHQMACISKWCAIMYNTSGVYDILMHQMKSTDEKLQEHASEIIQKMRLFALSRDGYIPKWLVEKHCQE